MIAARGTDLTPPGPPAPAPRTLPAGATAKLFLRLRTSRILLALAVLTAPAPAQQDTPTPPLTGIAYVTLRVRDLTASIAFYQKLGFEKAFELEPQSPPSAPGAAASSTAALRIAVLKINDRQFLELHPATGQQPDARLLRICFQSFDLEALAEDYQSRGLAHTPIATGSAGNLTFTIAGPVEPFGPQQIDFVEYQPGSLHTNDLGQHLGPDRVANSIIAVTLPMDDPDAARDFYINELNFKPVAGEQMDLHLPGNSGQEVDIRSLDLGSHAQITLNAPNLGKAARHLHKQGLAMEKSNEVLTLTDPDGNLILLETR